jgi:hypothetical protein
MGTTFHIVASWVPPIHGCHVPHCSWVPRSHLLHCEDGCMGATYTFVELSVRIRDWPVAPMIQQMCKCVRDGCHVHHCTIVALYHLGGTKYRQISVPGLKKLGSRMPRSHQTPAAPRGPGFRPEARRPRPGIGGVGGGGRSVSGKPMTKPSSRRDAIDAQLPNFFKPGTDVDHQKTLSS